MKPVFPGTLLCVLLFVCCGSRQRTLHLDKTSGPPERRMGVYMSTRDGSAFDAFYPAVRGLPAAWRDVTVYYAENDFAQLLYQSYRRGEIDEKLCMGYFNAWGRDTSSCSARPIRAVTTLAAGVTPEGRFAYLLDTDGDDDLADETVRYFGADSIACEATAVYIERYSRGVVLPDSTYVYPAFEASDVLLCCDERCSGEIETSGGRYAVTTAPFGGGYPSDNVEISFSNGDTTLQHRVGEFVLLGGDYYHIDSLRPDGRELLLTPTPDALDRPSAQVGFRPIPFEAATTEGRIVRFPEDFRGRYVLLDFWSLRCPPCLQEIRESYLQAYATYHAAGFEILGVASDPKERLQKRLPELRIAWPVVADNPEGRICRMYRIGAYPTLFLIDPEGRIVAQNEELRGARLGEWLRRIYPETEPSSQPAGE